MSVLVIIPAYNEAATLPAVLEDLRVQGAGLGEALDVVVVDDGSVDGTAQVARAGGAVVLRLPFNLGIGGALRTGFRYAVQQGYQRAVQLDADGQHDAAELASLLAGLHNADLVIGSRFATNDASYEVSRVRRAAMHGLRRLVRALTGQDFTDTSSGFRAFNRPMLEYFAGHYPSEYMESVEALVDASSAGFRIVEVPISMHQRAGGAPSNQRLKLVYSYVRVLVSVVTHASRRPVRRPELAEEGGR